MVSPHLSSDGDIISATLCQLNGFAKGSSSFLLLDCYDSQASEKKAEIYSNRKSLSMCRNVFLVFYISPKWKQHSNVPCMCKNTLLILLFLLSFGKHNCHQYSWGEGEKILLPFIWHFRWIYLGISKKSWLQLLNVIGHFSLSHKIQSYLCHITTLQVNTKNVALY